jgi:hypothetical protein
MSRTVLLTSRAGLMASGIVAAATPAIIQASAARLLPLPAQGVLALALTVSAFLGQVVTAAAVETPLAARAPLDRIVLPREVAIAGLIGAALFTWRESGVVADWVGLPLLSIALLWGRTSCIVHGRARREISAASIQGVLLVGGFAAAMLQPSFAFPLLALAAAAGIALRTDWVASVRGMDLSGGGRWRWIVGETTATGLLQPLVNGILLAALGPAGSVGYRIVATVSGGLEPIISFARTRLLVRHTRIDLVVSALAGTIAIAVAIVSATSGLLAALFGSGWSSALLVPLIIACSWRLTTLATTVPFASLRRSGRARLVFWLRLTSTGIYFALGVTAAFFQSVQVVFAAYAAAELLTFALYTIASRRVRAAHDSGEARVERALRTDPTMKAATQ